MSYRLISFNEYSGHLIVKYGDLPERAIEVPVEDGKYITGDALRDYLKGFVPVWEEERKRKVSAKPQGVEELKSMCEEVTQLPEVSYSMLRAKSYPPITDYLDAVVKGDQSAIDAYIDECLSVKARFPKPPEVSPEVLRQRREL